MLEYEQYMITLLKVVFAFRIIKQKVLAELA